MIVKDEAKGGRSYQRNEEENDDDQKLKVEIETDNCINNTKDRVKVSKIMSNI